MKVVSNGRLVKARTNSMNEYLLYWLLLIAVVALILVAILAVVGYLIRARCPNCDQWFVWQETGESRKEPGFFGDVLEERKCKYCDHRIWTVRPRNQHF